MIRDQYQGEAMARVMSLTSMVFIVIPMIAPRLVNGYCTLALGS